MKLFTALEFATDFPDDQVEEGDRIVRPGGQAVAGAIADILKDAGMTTSVPTLDYEHGWEFFAIDNEWKYWILVTDMRDKKLIQTKDVSSFFKRIFRNKNHYAMFLEYLYQLLSNQREFNSIKWFSYNKI